MTSEPTTKFEVFSQLIEIFNRKLSDGAVKRILKHFDDVSTEDFEKAIDMLIKNSDFMPSVSDIRDTLLSHFQSDSQNEDFEVKPKSNADYEDMQSKGLI